MPRMKWSKCKSPDTSQRNFLDFVEDSLKKWHMVNIIRGEKHVLFKVQFRYFSWVCEKSFTDCGRESYITEFTILSIDFAKMSDCMKCSCPWGSSENTQRGRKRTGQGTDMKIRTKTNEPTKSSDDKTLDSTINTILGGAVGGGAVLALGVGAVVSYFLWKKKKNKAQQESKVRRTKSLLCSLFQNFVRITTRIYTFNLNTHAPTV